MPKINHEEYEILKDLDDKWKWIARDKDNTLVMGAGKSERYLDRWFPPVNVGDSLVVDETNAVKDISEYGNLFQFIQWEDEEPCNIAELIKEYEYSAEHVSHVVNERVKALGKAWSESEETEVKSKQELIEEWESAIEAAEFYGKGKEKRLISYMKDFVSDLNQLDEPEVLSQEWIDEHQYIRMDPDNPFVYVKDLQNLLVPRQEEVDPDEARFNRKVNKIIKAIENPKRLKLRDVVEKMESLSEVNQKQWLDRLNEKFGEIEKEPKYYAKIKGHENIGSNDKYWNYNTDMEELSVGDSEVHPNVISEYVLKATKDEWASLGINDDNADFVKVEELEEC